MSYEAAVGCALAMGRVRPFELGRRAGIDWRVAVGYLDRMEQHGIVSRMDARGWRDVAAAQADESNSPACGFDRWNHLGRGEAELSHNRRQFNAVRHLIARELHPDLSDDSHIRALKAELFKRIWPQIADLLRVSAVT